MSDSVFNREIRDAYQVARQGWRAAKHFYALAHHAEDAFDRHTNNKRHTKCSEQCELRNALKKEASDHRLAAHFIEVAVEQKLEIMGLSGYEPALAYGALIESSEFPAV